MCERVMAPYYGCAGALVRSGLGVGLSSAHQCNIADTARQYCLGCAPDSPTLSPSHTMNCNSVRVCAPSWLRALGRTAVPCGMSPCDDPIPALKRDAVVHLAEIMRLGNGDDLGYLLGTDRFRIADLRRGRLARFSLETLIRFLARAGLRVELRVERVRRERAPR